MTADNEQAQPAKPKEATERLSDILVAKVGKYFHLPLSLNLTAHSLYWLVNLAEEGIKARAAQWKGDKKQLDMMDALNIGSFREDVENVLKAAEQAKVVKAPKTKKGK